MTINTSIGWCYCATFTQNGTVSDANGNILATCKADTQTTFQATTTQTIVSDDNAIVLPAGGAQASASAVAAESTTTLVQLAADQTFDATSTNAQSGVAVQEAVKLGGGTNYSIAIGSGSSSVGQNAIAIGRQSYTTETGSISIGQNSRADRSRAIALGAEAKALSYSNVSLGERSKTQGQFSLALGPCVYNGDAFSTALMAGQISSGTCDPDPFYQVHFFTKDDKVHLGIVLQREGILFQSWAYDLSQLTPTAWTPNNFTPYES